MFARGRILMNLPLRSLVFADVRWASNAERPGRVAALLALVLPGDDDLLRLHHQLVAFHPEARNALLVAGLGQRRVREVDPAALLEVGRELDPKQTVLLARVDRDVAR